MSTATKDEVVVSYACETDIYDHLSNVNRFSNYEKLIRTSAPVLAFIDKCRKRAKHIELRHVEEEQQ